MNTPDQFDPVDSAAMIKHNPPLKKQMIKPDQLAAMPDLMKKRPIILPVKPPKAEIKQSGNFPPPGDPYWKQNPIVTEHKDGTLRKWGEDTTQKSNPNLLPKQMLPPPSVPPKGAQNKDHYEGYSTPGSGSMRYHQD